MGRLRRLPGQPDPAAARSKATRARTARRSSPWSASVSLARTPGRPTSSASECPSTRPSATPGTRLSAGDPAGCLDPAPGRDLASGRTPVPPVCAVRYSSAASGRLSGQAPDDGAPDARGEAVPSSTVTRPPAGRHSHLRTSPSSTATSATRSATRWQPAVPARRAGSRHPEPSRFAMTVPEDQDVLDLDFRHTVTRPDLAAPPTSNGPGIYLNDVLETCASPRRRPSCSTATTSAAGATSSSSAASSSGSSRRDRSSTTATSTPTPAGGHAFFLSGPRRLPDRRYQASRHDEASRRHLARWTCGRYATVPPVRSLRIPADPPRRRPVWEHERAEGLGPGAAVRPRRPRLDSHRSSGRSVRTLIDCRRGARPATR